MIANIFRNSTQDFLNFTTIQFYSPQVELSWPSGFKLTTRHKSTGILKWSHVWACLIPRSVFETDSEACERLSLTYRTYEQMVSNNMSWIHKLIWTKLLEKAD